MTWAVFIFKLRKLRLTFFTSKLSSRKRNPSSVAKFILDLRFLKNWISCSILAWKRLISLISWNNVKRIVLSVKTYSATRQVTNHVRMKTDGRPKPFLLFEDYWRSYPLETLAMRMAQYYVWLNILFLKVKKVSKKGKWFIERV